jgi:hypothetical protein
MISAVRERQLDAGGRKRVRVLAIMYTLKIHGQWGRRTAHEGQGDQMSFRKIAQCVAQPILCLN